MVPELSTPPRGDPEIAPLLVNVPMVPPLFQMPKDPPEIDPEFDKLVTTTAPELYKPQIVSLEFD